MSLKVVDSDIGDRQGTVTIHGDSQEEVMSAAAKQMSIQAAAAGGLSRPGVSGNEVAYPVDAEGKTSDDLILGRSGATVAAYRCDYKVTGGL
jgi:hypothetical protein